MSYIIFDLYESVEDSNLSVVQKSDVVGWKCLSVVSPCLTRGILVTQRPKKAFF